MLFHIFHLCPKWETLVYQCVCPSQLFQMAEKQLTPHSQRDCWPGKSLLGWERSWGTEPPSSSSSSSHSVWCPGERALQTLPCQLFSHQPSQGLLPLGCIQLLWVRPRERGKSNPQCSKALLNQHWSEAYMVWSKSSSASVEEVGAGSSPFLAWTVTCN